MKTSAELRARLDQLDTASKHTAAAVHDARKAHAASIRSAVLTNDTETAAQTAAVLRAAEAEQHRVAAMVTECRFLLTQALRSETTAAREAVRKEVEAELVEMAAEASRIDATLVDAVACVGKLRQRELALRLKVRSAGFREVFGAPDFFGALRAVGSYLSATAAGLNPNPTHAVTRATASGAKAIRGALQDA